MFLVRKKWRGLSPPDKSGNYKNLEGERLHTKLRKPMIKKRLLRLRLTMVVKTALWFQLWNCPLGSR